ncbi:polysaccharide deacetylase family protein [Candidatus Nomurabacteria bacterium]|nr:polysaccharide deacetylase family protein [Candidatus Nomurabacteria bacterium]
MNKTFYFLIIFIFCFSFLNASAKEIKKPYNVPILVYHSFGPAHSKKESAMQKHYRVTEKVFEQQMKYLSDNGYHPITFYSYINSLKNNTELPEKAVILTFDDGWKTQYTYAVPILEKYHFTGTFFIISKNTNGSYMNWDNLKDLTTKGFEIASHTETHPMLTKLDAVKLKKEVEGSKKTLEDKLGIKVTTLAYPNYMQNETVRSAVKSAGYLGARGGWAKFKNSADHIYELTSQEVVNNPNPFSEKRVPDLP